MIFVPSPVSYELRRACPCAHKTGITTTSAEKGCGCYLPGEWFYGGGIFIGATNYTGYCMGASTFFALAYALNKKAHIRVGLLLNHLGKYRRFGKVWCFGIGATLNVFTFRGTYWSYKLNDVSQGSGCHAAVDTTDPHGDWCQHFCASFLGSFYSHHFLRAE